MQTQNQEQQKDPPCDMPIFHKGRYDKFVTSHFQEETINFRNQVKNIFATQIVATGSELVSI